MSRPVRVYPSVVSRSLPCAVDSADTPIRRPNSATGNATSPSATFRARNTSGYPAATTTVLVRIVIENTPSVVTTLGRVNPEK